MYIALIASIIVELLVYHRTVWYLRRTAAVFLLVYVAVISVAWVLFDPQTLPIAIVLCSVGRMINLFRLVVDRFDPIALRTRAFQTTVIVSIVQLSVVAAMAFGVDFKSDVTLIYLAGISAVISMILFGLTLWNIRQSHYVPKKIYYADRELPSVSICIPARNENENLEECIRFALSSDYPKLEIIVLDDSSQDNTPQIIKSFAHDGVRFVQGDEPDSHWLPKNLAYHRLAQEASGEYIIFAAVDIRFSPESIRRIVTAMRTNSTDMVSIVPQRYIGSYGGALIQPMRYWWEFVLPRKLFSRPPVLSSCWVIKRRELERAGGFAAVGKSIIPEAHFARYLDQNGRYSFLRSDMYLGVQTQKTLSAQRRTMIRLRYPQIHRRLELAYGLVLAEIMVLLGPFLMLVYALTSDDQLLTILSGLSVLVLTILHVSIIAVTSPPSVLVGLISLPLAIISEIYLSLLSVFKYEFSTVSWKGRRINSKQLEVISRLPEMHPRHQYPAQK